MRALSRLFALLVVVLFVSLSRKATACAVCGAADKTLPTKGEEIAFGGRMRLTLDGRAAGFAARFSDLRVTEVRLVPGASMAVSDSVLIGADVPLLRRTSIVTASPSGAQSSTVETDRLMLGDVEARASYIAYRTSSRRLSFYGGAKAPSAPLERDGSGTLLPTDLQPGCGSIVPMIGATYTLSGSLLSAWASTSFLMPMSVRSGPHPGDSLRASITTQLQPTNGFAARLGAHGRLDGAGANGDQIDPRSGGGSVFVSPELVASPVGDLVVSAGAAFPILQETRGHRATSPIAMLGVGWDF